MVRTTIVAVALATVGCTQPPSDVTANPNGLTITVHDDGELSGSYDAFGVDLQFAFIESEPNVVDVSYDFGDQVIAFRLDYAQGSGDFDPSAATLREDQKAAIEAFYQALQPELTATADDRSLVEDVAVRITSLMHIIPAGEQLEAGTFVAQRGWVHISCSCKTQYIGSGYYRKAGKGDWCTGGSGRGCKGRCGVGCGYDNLCWGYATGTYTRDCAKHDYGLGSWWSASDDYSFSSYNCC